MSFTDDLGTISTILGEITGILTHGELERPAVSNKKPADASIALKNVTFAYHDEEVLHGIDMEMKQGTVSAIVGHFGKRKVDYSEADSVPVGCGQRKYLHRRSGYT